MSLYNALNMSHYENPDDLEIITLDNALFLQMKNDVAFLINTNEMCLIEHSKDRLLELSTTEPFVPSQENMK